MGKIKENIRRVLILLVVFVFTMNFDFCNIKAAVEDEGIENAKNSIVKIYAGSQNNAGKFKKTKSANGFLIARMDGHNYIVTSHDVINTKGNDKVIKVVVRGDTTVEAQVLTESMRQNYAILIVEDGLENKTILGIKEQDQRENPVYALGFDNQPDTKYEKNNVAIVKGIYNSSDGYQIKLKPSPRIESGGPMISSKGYVVGIYNGLSKDLTAKFTPASELKEILKSFNIEYATDRTEQIDRSFMKILKRCQKKVRNSTYKTASKQELETIIVQIDTAQSNTNLTATQKQAYEKKLKNAEKQLQKKMPMQRKIIYVFMGLIVCLLLWFMHLVNQISRLSEEKRKNNDGKKEEIISDETKEESKNKRAYLEVKDLNRTLRIDKEEFYIGKKDTMDLILEGVPTISRCHALITFDGKDYYIEDKGSSNGTFVNGRELEEGRKEHLSSGDIIMLAEITAIFEEK